MPVLTRAMKKNTLKKATNQRLSQRNRHERDNNIKFYEKGHVYDVDGDRSYTSVTKLVHRFANPFDTDMVIRKILEKNTNEKYKNMTAKEIANLWRIKEVSCCSDEDF